MKNNWRKRLAICAAFLICCCVSGYLGRAFAAYIPQQEVGTVQIEEDTVLVGGVPVGIYMETEGILVLNTQSVTGIDGREAEPARNLVKAGDYIVAVNGKAVEDKEELLDLLAELTDGHVVLKLRRNGELIEVKLDAVEYAPGAYRLGIWVRDNVQGLGTITFLDKNGTFGALGHGIHDADTGVLMEIDQGNLYRTSVRSITKGKNGAPGSMEGVIIYSNYNRLGTIEKNTKAGIYGTVRDAGDLFQDQMTAQVASREEIQVGEASIRCCLDGEVREYAVQITDVNYLSPEVNKGIVLQVTDAQLMEKTGGIVQGMSGSPILQNGKIIGAVTHVFVNDPSKGYGIFIENMLKEAQNPENRS